MNKKSRFYTLLLALLMLCSMSLMTACNDSEKPTEISTESTESKESTEATEDTGSSESTEDTGTSESTEPTDATDPSSTTEDSATTESTDSTEPTGEVTYKVTLVDGLGNPYTKRVKVLFSHGNSQLAMVFANGGVAETVLPVGDYDVSVVSFSADTKLYYDASNAKVTADTTEIRIVVADETVDNNGEYVVPFEQIFAGGEDRKACYVNTGSTHILLTEGGRSYFLFAPTQIGTYEISVTYNAASLGIYGASIHFIMDFSTHEVVDNKISFSVQPSMIGTGNTGTTTYVVGLDSVGGATECVVNVVRTGDPEWSFTEQPWTNYVPKQEITPFVLSQGAVLKTFDLTAATDAYQFVLNEEDGYYHLGSANGPVVYVQVGQSVKGISLMGMVGEIIMQNGVPMQTGSAPFRYSYNNGKDDFFREDYTDAMRQYVTNRDKTSGVYPLTEDLYYLLPLGIEQMGWCRKDTANYLFADQDDINPDIAWMFLLVYDAGAPDSSDPTDPTDPADPTEPSEPSEPTVCEHVYAVTEEKAATCTTKGSKTYTCELCSDTYTDIIFALGHDYSQITCTEPKTCKNCGATIGEALGHNYYEATCVRAKTCKICGAVEGEPLDHDFGDTGKCSRCGTVDPNCVHDYVTVSSKDATCTEPGWFESVCSKCGEQVSGDVPELSHSYLDATCVAPKSCEICGVTEGEALGHNYGEDGNCARCGEADPYYVIGDNKNEPITIGGTLFFDAEVQSKHLVYFDLYRVSGTTLTINNANAYVIYDGARYDAVDGVVTVPNLYSAYTNSPVSLAIGNIGDDATFAVTMSYPAGSLMNPYALELGTVIVNSETGNDQGVYYTWKADADGVLTIKLESITEGVDCKIDLFNLGSFKNEILDTTDGQSVAVSVEVIAGQNVRIIIGALPDENNNYPAAQIKLSVSLT